MREIPPISLLGQLILPRRMGKYFKRSVISTAVFELGLLLDGWMWQLFMLLALLWAKTDPI